MPGHGRVANRTAERLQKIFRFGNSDYKMDFDRKGLNRLERGYKKG